MPNDPRSIRPVGRLSTWAAAMVVARRDFTAILFSRSFIFFLLGPLFPVVVGALAGSVGTQAQSQDARPVVGVAMAAPMADKVMQAHRQLVASLGGELPDFVVSSGWHRARLSMPSRFCATSVPIWRRY